MRQIATLSPKTGERIDELPGGTPLQNSLHRRATSTLGVADGTRTRDRLDHNQELYQLSYSHRVHRLVSGNETSLTSPRARRRIGVP